MIRFSLIRLLSGIAFLLLAGCMMGAGTPGSRAPETEQVAQAALSVGEYEEAARLFERAAERDPRSVNALLGLGKSYTELGQFSRASNALNAALAIRPGNAETRSELGRLALYQGEPEVALGEFDAALKLDRRNLAALTGKAVSLDFLSRHAEAQMVYQQALAIYPTNFALLSNNALSMVLSGNTSGGIAVLEELLRDVQHGETVRANLAIAYVFADRKTDALAMLVATMSDAEAQREVRLYEGYRKEFLDGKPVGHLVFQ